MELITKKEINLSELLSLAHHKKAGAVVLFSGEARNHSDGKGVEYLEYEAHKPMAEKMIQEIIDQAKEKWSLHFAICVHRIGRVDISESSIAIVTSSSHREDAYAANRFIIEQVKKDAPIWKKEHFKNDQKAWR